MQADRHRTDTCLMLSALVTCLKPLFLTIFTLPAATLPCRHALKNHNTRSTPNLLCALVSP